jgi:hypothetical protein
MTNYIPGPAHPYSMSPQPAVLGFEPIGSGGLQPYVSAFPVNAASAPIRLADILTLSGGSMSRGSNASSSILGFACDGSQRTENAQIPAMPFISDQVLGVNLLELRAYLAGNGNTFMGNIPFGETLLASNVGTTCDFLPALVAAAPTLTTHGTAGSTTLYYSAIPVNPVGEALGINGTALTTANATQSATNYNIVTIANVAGASWFNIYRGTANNNGVLIAQVPANPTGTTVYNDTGATGQTGLVVSTTNNSGWFVDPNTDSVGQVTIIGLVDPIGTVSAPGTVARVRFKIPSTVQAL